VIEGFAVAHAVPAVAAQLFGTFSLVHGVSLSGLGNCIVPPTVTAKPARQKNRRRESDAGSAETDG
jgi:hypothetical protein